MGALVLRAEAGHRQGAQAIYPRWQERGPRRCAGVSSSSDKVPSDFLSEIGSAVIGYEVRM